MNKFTVNLLDNDGAVLDSFIEYANYKEDVLDVWGRDCIEVIDLGTLTKKQIENSLKLMSAKK